MRNTAITSIINYHNHIKGSHEDGQDKTILEAIKKIQPCSGRMIERYLNYKIENSSIARSLNNLKKENKIESTSKEYCKVTGKLVQFYRILDPQLTLL